MAILEVSNIGKSFGKTEVLTDISFSLEKGESLAIIGSSGSGKTTLLKLISGLEVPDGGEILLDGKVLSAKRTKEDYRSMQMIFQDAIASFHPRRTIAASIRAMISSAVCA